ncbi:MAG: alpha/beta hydrolase [Rhodospirillaceae bacterium]|nr:alpha/beta hydrolase [Rhodospirillaceae bacterium]
MSMKEKSVHCLGKAGFHQIAYTEWGAPEAARTLICVHGLTRNGRDFDTLASALEDQYRIICPDVVGRGKSDWLQSGSEYQNPNYLADLATLLAKTGAREVDWLGTSMGGILGMLMATVPGNPIKRLIINDVGPFLPKAALERIASYTGNAPDFDDLAALESYLRDVHATFGDLTDGQWRHMAETSHRTLEGGKVALAYDPAIGDNFRAGPLDDVDMWGFWDLIRCPTLVLRGETSDLLRQEDAEAMTQRGPKAELVEIPGCGHAPALMAADQIAIVRDWLNR